MRERVPRIAILSAHRTENDDRLNQMNQALLRDCLKAEGLHGMSGIGCYDGTLEQSELVRIDSDDDLDKVLALAASFQQESVLIREPDRVCRLHYLATEKRETIGEWEEVEETFAKDQIAWSMFDGHYFIAK